MGPGAGQFTGSVILLVKTDDGLTGILDGAPGIAGYELNISCPNIAHGLDLGRDPQQAARVTAAVRGVTPRCVIVKLSPNVTDIAAVAAAVESAGADAVSAVNTYVGMKIHRHLRRPVLPRAPRTRPCSRATRAAQPWPRPRRAMHP